MYFFLLYFLFFVSFYSLFYCLFFPLFPLIDSIFSWPICIAILNALIGHRRSIGKRIKLVLFKKIPSLVDGFKPVQRKIIHTCFKRDDQRAVKLLQLAGTVYELCAYHHNEMYLMETIIRFAQNFTGSNNINQLRRHGQFGTRFEGGTDAAQPPSNLVPN